MKTQYNNDTLFNQLILKTSRVETPLGPMTIIADEIGLYLLEFIDCRGLDNEIKTLRKTLNATIDSGETSIIQRIKSELTDYFAGRHFKFKTPLHLMGSLFQKNVWAQLKKIPPGQTRAYSDIAKSINAPRAYRAVARANSTNQLAIIIPCHRVINVNGTLGGYAGGVQRKQWLLEHEKFF